MATGCFSTLAWEISRYNNLTIELEGHTESGHPPMRADYGDWEISADRANAVRRKLLEHGVTAEPVRKVAGFGDRPDAGRGHGQRESTAASPFYSTSKPPPFNPPLPHE